MSAENKCSFIGRLVADPEEIKTQKEGVTMAKYRLAVDSGYGDRKQTAFLDCLCFNKTAEYLLKYLRKGSLLAMDSEISPNDYEKDVQGEKVKMRAYQFKANSIKGLDPKDKDPSVNTSSSSSSSSDSSNTGDSDEDIPF